MAFCISEHGIADRRPVLADGELYVVAGVVPPVGTKITSVPYTISTPGFYFLAGNLTYSGSSNAITISVDDVTLDLMGCILTNAAPKALPTASLCRGAVMLRSETARLPALIMAS